MYWNAYCIVLHQLQMLTLCGHVLVSGYAVVYVCYSYLIRAALEPFLELPAKFEDIFRY
jgi:hypothetical protein